MGVPSSAPPTSGGDPDNGVAASVGRPVLLRQCGSGPYKTTTPTDKSDATATGTAIDGSSKSFGLFRYELLTGRDHPARRYRPKLRRVAATMIILLSRLRVNPLRRLFECGRTRVPRRR